MEAEETVEAGAVLVEEVVVEAPEADASSAQIGHPACRALREVRHAPPQRRLLEHVPY